MKQLNIDVGHAEDHRALSQEQTGRDLAEVVRLLKCKLAWYGFRSVRVGPFIRIKGRKVLIDFLGRGEVLCPIELASIHPVGTATHEGGS
jgi:hypothetical protein